MKDTQPACLANQRLVSNLIGLTGTVRHEEDISSYVKNRVFLNKHLNTQKYCTEKVQIVNCDIKQRVNASNKVGTANFTVGTLLR